MLQTAIPIDQAARTGVPTSANAPAPGGNPIKMPPFTQIPNALLTDGRLKPNARFLYCVIVSHVNRSTKEAFPSIDCLVGESGLSRSTVIRETKALESTGWIIAIRERDETGCNRVNRYRPLFIPNREGGSISRIPPVVSVGNTNQINSFNHKKEGGVAAPPKAVRTALPRDTAPAPSQKIEKQKAAVEESVAGSAANDPGVPFEENANHHANAGEEGRTSPQTGARPPSRAQQGGAERTAKGKLKWIHSRPFYQAHLRGLGLDTSRAPYIPPKMIATVVAAIQQLEAEGWALEDVEECTRWKAKQTRNGGYYVQYLCVDLPKYLAEKQALEYLARRQAFQNDSGDGGEYDFHEGYGETEESDDNEDNEELTFEEELACIEDDDWGWDQVEAEFREVLDRANAPRDEAAALRKQVRSEKALTQGREDARKRARHEEMLMRSEVLDEQSYAELDQIEMLMRVRQEVLRAEARAALLARQSAEATQEAASAPETPAVAICAPTPSPTPASAISSAETYPGVGDAEAVPLRLVPKPEELPQLHRLARAAAGVGD